MLLGCARGRHASRLTHHTHALSLTPRTRKDHALRPSQHHFTRACTHTRSHLRACSSSRHVWHKLHANTPHSTHLNPTGNEKTTRHTRPATTPLAQVSRRYSHTNSACRACGQLNVCKCGAADCVRLYGAAALQSVWGHVCVCVCVGVGVLRRGSLVRVRVCVCGLIGWVDC